MEDLVDMLTRRCVLKVLCLFSAAALVELLGLYPRAEVAAQSTGAVYVLSNQDENAVLIFNRSADGTLTPAGRVATGGSGAGEGANPLRSQGSVILSADNRMLFAVNAGSNSISALSVSEDGSLTLLQTISSGGNRPVSLTASHDLLYVLNAGDSANISGFTIQPGDSPLTALDGSTQAIPGGEDSAPAEVVFTPEANVLIVTERATSTIDGFAVDESGRAAPANSYTALGPNPLGCAFSHDNLAIIAYSDHNAEGQAGAGSYRVSEPDEVAPVSPSVADNGTGLSWAVVTRSGQIAFTTEMVSGTVSSFAVSPESGNVILINGAAATITGGEEGSALPSDLALSNNSRFLYVRAGNGSVTGFQVHEGGSLTPVAHVTGLPERAVGLAAR